MADAMKTLGVSLMCLLLFLLGYYAGTDSERRIHEMARGCVNEYGPVNPEWIRKFGACPP